MSGVILVGDSREQLRTLADKSVHCVVTSPPYWALRDYGVAGQLGLEASPEEYVAAMVEVFAEVWRVLRNDGTLWLNIGDSYANDPKGPNGADKSGLTGGGQHQEHCAGRVKKSWRRDRAEVAVGGHRSVCGLKRKDLVGIPWRLAFALQDAGWYLRQDIIWSKPSPMPESVRDRCTKSHEYIFLLTKSERYYFDAIAIQEKAAGTAHSRRGVGSPDSPGVNPKAAGKKFGTKQNASFSAAVTDVVEHRNARSVWKISSAGFPGAHFATFPPALPERCIKAGTSERGCCPDCGAPWKRIVEKQRVATRPGTDTKTTGDSMVDGNRDPLRHVTRTVTTGWQPTCKCEAAAPVPCTVLDPFFGAGTTGLVANHLGRNYIGCELNSEYAKMAEDRIAVGYQPKKPKKPRIVPHTKQLTFEEFLAADAAR